LIRPLASGVARGWIAGKFGALLRASLDKTFTTNYEFAG
jgi:hypothetical protein